MIDGNLELIVCNSLAAIRGARISGGGIVMRGTVVDKGCRLQMRLSLILATKRRTVTPWAPWSTRDNAGTSHAGHRQPTARQVRMRELPLGPIARPTQAARALGTYHPPRCYSLTGKR
ncbi:hypothetical protein TKK_0017587 [Trichogramma kaykai]